MGLATLRAEKLRLTWSECGDLGCETQSSESESSHWSILARYGLESALERVQSLG